MLAVMDRMYRSVLSPVKPLKVVLVSAVQHGDNGRDAPYQTFFDKLSPCAVL